MTIKVWPQGWVCQALRALGSNVTQAQDMRDGSPPANSGAALTLPLKNCSGPSDVGSDLLCFTSM